MTLSMRPYLAFANATLGAAVIVAVPLASPPSAIADGGVGGSGGGTVTGPGGTVLGSASGQVTGVESIPGGLPGLPGCISGGCSGSLSTIAGIPGPIAPPIGSPGLQITPTINLPPNPISCITAQCHGSGSLSTSGGVSTPIVSATGGLNGYIHG